jgi:hypothetical protein|tara:strand:- start:2223 stop:2696 length:474 start_codon:yes stop_codon:yes gene_type:complete
MEADRKPWKVLLEFRGQNKRNGGWSEKWWSLSGNGTGTVEVNHGKIGSNGRSSPFVFDLQKGLDTLHKKLNDGYLPATGSMTKVPPLDDNSKHVDLPGIYRDVRFISKKFGSQVYVAHNEQGDEVCRLTQAGASRLIGISNLIRTRTDPLVVASLGL